MSSPSASASASRALTPPSRSNSSLTAPARESVERMRPTRKANGTAVMSTVSTTSKTPITSSEATGVASTISRAVTATAVPVQRTGLSARRWTGPNDLQRRINTTTRPPRTTTSTRRAIASSTVAAVSFDHTSSRLSGHSSQSSFSKTSSESGPATVAVNQTRRTTLRSRPGATRPVGNATSMCTSAAIHSELSAKPIVNAHALSVLVSAPRNQKKPTIVISAPMRFSGRRHHAYRPAPMNAQPSVSASTTDGPGTSSRSLVVTKANAASPSAKPATASARSARLRPLMERR